jgi:two-component system, NarL family, sensor histidine kinase UhpB
MTDLSSRAPIEPASPLAINSGRRFWHRAGTSVRTRSRRVPLYYRVLSANAAVVVFGAIAGTAITTSIGRQAPEYALIPLIVLFAAIGIGLSLLVNALLLRAAFRPMSTLNRTAAAVQDGDRDARAAVDASSDPEMAQLARALNATLDELADDRNQLRDLASQVISAQEDERRRVSRELHDDTAQVLFAQLLHVTALKSSDDPRIQEVAGRLEQSTVAALEGVRRLALELRPPALDDLGLAEALGELCQRFREATGCSIKLDVRGMRGRLSAEVELVLYRVAQEALTNVAKHAKATLVTVDLERTEHDVSLSVKDNGTGFDRSRFSPSDGVGLGLGLFGMEERATLLGGTLRIWSTPGQGTEVFAFVPLHRHETPS